MTYRRALSAISREYFALISALGLMTRIPIGLVCFGRQLNTEDRHRSQIWYPWVGLLIGLLIYTVAFFLSSWPELTRAVIVLVVWIGLTGALHLDGFADSVDAWVGGMGTDREESRSRSLAIMKDPASGPMAVVALVLLLLLKCALIYQILSSTAISGIADMALIAVPMITVPMLARFWLLPLLRYTEYARKPTYDAHNVQTSERMSQQDMTQQNGMASEIARDFPHIPALVSGLICLILLLGLIVLCGQTVCLFLILGVSGALLTLFIRKMAISRIGGYTGDILGALIEMQEVMLLLVFCFFLSL